MSIPAPQPQTVIHFGFRRGMEWWIDSFRMMVRMPIRWYLMGFVLTAVISIIPAVFSPVMAYIGRHYFVYGIFFMAFLGFTVIACFAAGIALAGGAQAHGEKPGLSHLLGGFRPITVVIGGMMTVVTVATFFAIYTVIPTVLNQ